VTQDDFQRLEIGTGVRFFPRRCEEGPQASTVQIVDKPGSRISKTGRTGSESPGGRRR
jgi:hypothetical protein